MAKNSIGHYGKREMKVDRQHILGMDKTCITLTWTQLRRKIQRGRQKGLWRRTVERELKEL